MPPRSPDLLVLGIDAADPDLIEQWAADGTLPHLGALIRRGFSGRTHSVDGFFIGATWPSFFTGVTPARHGIHYMVQFEPGTGTLYRPAAADYVRRPPFWHALASAGRRVAVLDVPLSRIDPGIDALQIVEWGGHDAVFGFRACPPEAGREILKRFGSHPLGPTCDATGRQAGDYARFIDTLLAGVRTKAALTTHMLHASEWNFFMQVFTEAHCAGHQCWHLHDPTHPAHDPIVAAVTGDPLRRVYTAIDDAIGQVLASAGNARILILAAHGMKHAYGAQFLLPEILFRLGVAHPAASATDPRTEHATRASLRWVWRRLPAPVRRALEPLRAHAAGERRRSVLPALDADLARSACFVVPNGLAVGGIRLNLAGREAAGVLAPAQADAFCADLRDALLGIVDERTGGPVVRRVLRTRDCYEGEHLGALPDMLVEWDDAAATGSAGVGGGAASTVRVHSPRIGILEGQNSYARTGEHRPEGMFIAAGPGIPAGRRNESTSILDFAPTLAAMLGVQITGTDGRLIPGLAIPR